MTTAIDNWARRQSGGNSNMDGSGEGESMLDGLDPAGDRLDGEPDDDLENHAAGQDGQGDHAGHDAEPADDEFAKKKAKDKKIMMAGGGVVVLVAIATAALKFMAPAVTAVPNQPPQVQQAKVMAPQQSPGQVESQSPVVEAPGRQEPEASPLDLGAQNRPPEGGVAPLHDASPVVGAGTQVASAFPAAGQATEAHQPGGLPMPTGMPGAGSPMELAAPTKATTPAAGPTSAMATGSANSTEPNAEINSIREDLKKYQRDTEKAIADLKKSIDQLRVQKTAKQEAPAKLETARAQNEKRNVTQDQKAARKFSGITETAEVKAPEKYSPIPAPVMNESKVAPVAPAATTKGGKVRGDFTVYAISNGRAWVKWSVDGENYMVALNSILPDNTRVTSISDEKGIVFSSAGEIHPKPAK